MSQEEHHQEALIETARSELDRAHRAAISLEAGEVRRGLQLALTALTSANESGAGHCGALANRIGTALADLDKGELAEMALIIEAVRKEIEA